MRHYYSQNSAVRAIRTIRKGEELLDNYGYHYADLLYANGFLTISI